MLIHLLSHESNDVQTAAAQALGVMSENLLSKDSIREWGKSRQRHVVCKSLSCRCSLNLGRHV